MANTYSQIYLHIIFSTKSRQHRIPSEHKDALHRFIIGIINNRKAKAYAVNSMPDHVHILLSIAPDLTTSDLVRDIKAGASKFINDNKWVPYEFHWQKGYGVFSCSQSSVDAVVKYIANQEEHHKKQSFQEEYLEFLKRYGIEFDLKYVFDDAE